MTRWDDWTWEERSSPAPRSEAAFEVDDNAPTRVGSGARAGASSAGEGTQPQGTRAGSDSDARPQGARASLDGGSRPGGHAPHVFRRRRAGAGVAALAVLALLIAALSAKGGAGHAHTASHRSHVAQLAPSAAERAADQSAAEQKAIEKVLSYTPALTSGGPSGDEVALTFDDGPGPYTQRLVAELNALGVHATFFAIGNQEQYFSQGTVDELDSGDTVGDHTETHPMMAQLSAHDQYEQLFDQMAQIEVLGGKRPRLFRPPYGSFDATTFRELHHLRLLMVLWSVDTGDYTLPGSEVIAQRALAGAKPGAIILMHDAGGDRSQTIAALPAIVSGLRKRGLRPVTVGQLLIDDPPPPGQPIPTALTGG